MGKDNERKGNYSKKAPIWRQSKKGFNFEAICKNVRCQAFEKRVVIPIGAKNLDDGTQNFDIGFLRSQELFRKCPGGCGLLGEDAIDNVYLCECEYEIQTKLEATGSKVEKRRDKTEKDYVTWKVSDADLTKYQFIRIKILKIL